MFECAIRNRCSHNFVVSSSLLFFIKRCGNLISDKMWEEDMILELHDLQRSLKIKKSAIEVGVDNLEDGQKARDVKRKEHLLREMKQVLTELNKIDREVEKDMKGEAFDFLHSINKITDEIATMKDSLIDPLDQNESKWKTEVNALKARIVNMECDEFVSCLSISVSIQLGAMAAAVERVSDSIFLETPLLNPKHFFLEMPEKQPLAAFQLAYNNPNYVDVRIHFVGEGSPSTISFFLLQKLMMTLTCQLPGHGIRVMEDCSVWSKMEKKKAVVSKDGTCITVQLKRPNFTVCKISVHLLGSNIVNSPVLHQFFQNDKTHM